MQYTFFLCFHNTNTIYYVSCVFTTLIQYIMYPCDDMYAVIRLVPTAHPPTLLCPECREPAGAPLVNIYDATCAISRTSNDLDLLNCKLAHRVPPLLAKTKIRTF